MLFSWTFGPDLDANVSKESRSQTQAVGLKRTKQSSDQSAWMSLSQTQIEGS